MHKKINGVTAVCADPTGRKDNFNKKSVSIDLNDLFAKRERKGYSFSFRLFPLSDGMVAAEDVTTGETAVVSVKNYPSDKEAIKAALKKLTDPRPHLVVFNEYSRDTFGGYIGDPSGVVDAAGKELLIGDVVEVFDGKEYIGDKAVSTFFVGYLSKGNYHFSFKTSYQFVMNEDMIDHTLYIHK